jgi:hypothetical protein
VFWKAVGVLGQAGEWRSCESVPEKKREVREEETDGWGPSVSEREGERVDWAGAGLADPGSAQCCLISLFFSNFSNFLF